MSSIVRESLAEAATRTGEEIELLLERSVKYHTDPFNTEPGIRIQQLDGTPTTYNDFHYHYFFDKQVITITILQLHHDDRPTRQATFRVAVEDPAQTAPALHSPNTTTISYIGAKLRISPPTDHILKAHICTGPNLYSRTLHEFDLPFGTFYRDEIVYLKHIHSDAVLAFIPLNMPARPPEEERALTALYPHIRVTQPELDIHVRSPSEHSEPDREYELQDGSNYVIIGRNFLDVDEDGDDSIADLPENLVPNDDN